MPQLVAVLRAINAGPGRIVRMNELRQAFESLGFRGVATFLGSGNVVFETRATDVGTLERKIERKLERTLGNNVPVFIRTPAELKKIAAFEPFEISEIHGADVNIILLADNVDERSKAKLVATFKVRRPARRQESSKCDEGGSWLARRETISLLRWIEL